MLTTTELTELLPLIASSGNFKLINSRQAAILTAVDNYTALVHIENATGTVDWLGNALLDCPEGSYRLWPIKEWQLTDNKRAALRKQAELDMVAFNTEKEAYLSMRDQLVKYFLTIGVPEIVTTNNILKGSDSKQLETIINGLRANGAAI